MLVALVVALAAMGAAGGASFAAPASPPKIGAELLARVVLFDEPVVSADVIRLGDIARVESDDQQLQRRLEALEVGRAALPGQSRHIHAGTLRLRMRQARLPERQIEIVAANETITVTTAYQALDVDRLREVVREWYTARSTLPDGATLHLNVEVAAEMVPAGAVEVRVAMAAPKWGSATVPLEIRVDDRIFKRINANVEALVEQPVWVTTRPFNRGESVSQSDVQLVRQPFPQTDAGPATFDRPLRTTRYVREGTALTWDVVEPIPVVAKGEHVMVVAAKGSVVVQVPGEAMSDGHVGESLAVRNLGSGNVVYGTLTEDGTVLVQVW